MSNRRKIPQPDGTVKKVYMPRSERRAARAARRDANGAPPERRVGPSIGGQGKSYLGQVETYEPATGEALSEPHDAGNDRGHGTMFLIEGTQYVYDQLGGHRAYLEWAREHPTKFRELAMKLLPAQVTVMQQNLVGKVEIVHALQAPAYNPAKAFDNPPDDPPTPAENTTVTQLQQRKGKGFR